MSFPNIQIKATSLELTDELSSLVDQKIQPLEKFFPADESNVTCQVELERVAEQQSGKIFRAEINLRIAGKLYRAEATEDQIEKAIDVVRGEVKREIRKAYDKKRSLFRRGRQRIKEMITFGGE